jgi:glycosyltransferase involved in cell wall biosynthesis
LNSNKIKIIENPVDREVFYPKDTKNLIRKKLQLKQKDKFILFFGQLNYKPNIEALEIIKNEIIPRLDSYKKQYKIAVCGAGNGKGFLKEFKHKNIIFKGFVNKIQDYINASDVVIVPLKSGSGTRIKILEALACKKRVISTSIGAEGIKPNKLLEVEDDWNKFVEKI